MTIVNNLDIWPQANDVPIIVISFALPAEKRIEVFDDPIVPTVDIYDVAVTTAVRRRVQIF